MQVELINGGNGYRYTITSRDSDLIAKWLKEYVPEMLATPISHGPWRIQFYPTDEKEVSNYFQQIRVFNRELFAQDLVSLAELIVKGLI